MSKPPELSFRVDEKIAANLDQLAQATEQDRGYHLTRALTQYLDSEMRHLQAIAEGIADADTGNLLDLDLVTAKWEKHAGGNAG
jgi:predicted transcriptional regulator